MGEVGCGRWTTHHDPLGGTLMGTMEVVFEAASASPV